MMIEMDEDFDRKKVKSRNLSDAEVERLEEIFCLCGKEKLFFKASLGFYQLCKNKYHKYFSRFAKQFVNYVIDHYSTLTSETNGIDPIIKLSETGTKNLCLSSPAYCSIDGLPFNLTPILYCENINDAKYYKKVFETLNPNTPLHIDLDSFGGNNLDTIKYKVEQRKIVYCIFDSDKDFEEDGLGDTANEGENFFLNNEHPFSYYYILKVREIENLIPLELLKTKGLITDRGIKTMISAIGKGSSETKDFFDVKSGYDEERTKEVQSDEDWMKAHGETLNLLLKKGQTRIDGIGRMAERIDEMVFKEKYFRNMKTMNQQSDIDSICNLIGRLGFVCKRGLS